MINKNHLVFVTTLACLLTACDQKVSRQDVALEVKWSQLFNAHRDDEAISVAKNIRDNNLRNFDLSQLYLAKSLESPVSARHLLISLSKKHIAEVDTRKLHPQAIAAVFITRAFISILNGKMALSDSDVVTACKAISAKNLKGCMNGLVQSNYTPWGGRFENIELYQNAVIGLTFDSKNERFYRSYALFAAISINPEIASTLKDKLLHSGGLSNEVRNSYCGLVPLQGGSIDPRDVELCKNEPRSSQ